MRILRSARKKTQLCLQNLCGFMFRLGNDWFNVAVRRPCGQFIHRTDPYGSRPVINITPGHFRGPCERAPKGSRPASLDTVRCPLYLLTRIGEKESRGARPFACRSPGGPLVQLAGSFMGCLRATGLNKTPGELKAASSTHRRPYGFLKLSRRPWNRTEMVKISIFTRRTGPGSDL